MMRRVLAIAAWMFAAAGIAFGQQGATAAIQEGYATTSGGVRIHYLQAGDAGSARALVLIPGWRLPAYLWEEQLKNFGRANRVIAIDPRSQGESDKTTEGNTPETRAKDLHDLLGKLGVKRMVLIGWSQGAQDVAAYLGQFGTDSIEGVVFVDSPVSAGPSEIEMHREFSKAILSNIPIYASHPEEYSEGMVQALFKKLHPELDHAKVVKSTMQTPVDTGISMLVMDIFGADRRAVLTKLNRPALVIASAASPLLDVQKEMAGSIPVGKLVVLEGTGHAVFVDEPEKFDEALGKFLEGLGKE
jgi:microsomal epoxide hydrolase